MPYVEVWVEPEMDSAEVNAVRDLVKVAKEVAMRQWPADDAMLLERTASVVARIVGGARETTPLFPADEKYRKWREEAKSVETNEP